MPTIAPPDLRAGDLRLRLPTAADVPALVRTCRDPDIQRWTQVPAGYTEEDARSFALMATGALAEGTGIHLLAVPADGPEGEVLGCVGLSLPTDGVAAELGYWTAAHARGGGVAVTAGRLLCGFALDRLALPVVHLLAAVANAPSVTVAERIGFRHVGVMRRGLPDRSPGTAEGIRLDAHLFDLLPEDLTER